MVPIILHLCTSSVSSSVLSGCLLAMGARGMKPYIGLVHKDEGSAFGITFPDAPGCFSAADSLDDLFPMAEEALGLWIDDKLESRSEIAPLRALSDIMSDPEWSESFADAMLIIAVPSPLTHFRDAA